MSFKKTPDECETAADLDECSRFLKAKETELRIRTQEYELEHKRGLYTRIDVAQAEYERVANDVVRSFEGFPDRIREMCAGVTPAIYNAMRKELERILEGHRQAALHLEPTPTIKGRDKEREKKAKHRAKSKEKTS